MERKWWHGKVAYQIYPKSFLDTNGDGIGDIRGIIKKLDYLKDLGIDIIWISPIYASPFVDQGYDISDYYSIAPQFGTMEEFKELLQKAKERDMYIVMDLVLNHCSDQHEWFQKALADPNGEYADYFYFREGKNGEPPSNYRSIFGGSAWEKIEGSNKYYLHTFAKQQPDLNWTNPKVRQELYKMINWWQEKGVAGFRLDAIINIKKDTDFPCFEPDGADGLVSITRMIDETNGIGEFLQEMKQQTFAKKDAFTVAEVFQVKEEELEEFIGERGYFSTMFDFSAHCLSMGEHGWYDAKKVEFLPWRKTIFDAQLQCSGIGFLANIIENHDEPRGASRYLPEFARNEKGIQMLAAVSVLLRGLPFLYQGQEIGMQNIRMQDITEYEDINTVDQYQLALESGCSKEQALEICYENSRDNSRTPMQWNEKENAGFTVGRPWFQVNPDYKVRNVEEQKRREDSVLNFYKQLLRLRKSGEWKEVLTYGDFVPMYEEMDSVFAYVRRDATASILVAANFSEEVTVLPVDGNIGRLLLTNTEADRWHTEEAIRLDSCQVIVCELT